MTALWLCADLDHPAAHSPDALLARFSVIIARSPATLWLRPAKTHSARALLSLCRGAVEIAHKTSSLVIVGERLDVALAAGAHGVHLPAGSLPPDEVRSLAQRLRRDDFLVSCAVHDRNAMLMAERGAHTAVLSPLREVQGKGQALGVRGFRALRDASPTLRVIALGGITAPEHARDARCAGADGFAIRRAWLESHDPAETCEAMLRAFGATDKAVGT